MTPMTDQVRINTELAKRMVARADADGLGADHQLRDLATKFEAAAVGFYSEPQTVTVKSFMGAWARARRAWCNYTGEPLI
jgi:hypothetical protein